MTIILLAIAIYIVIGTMVHVNERYWGNRFDVRTWLRVDADMDLSFGLRCVARAIVILLWVFSIHLYIEYMIIDISMFLEERDRRRFLRSNPQIANAIVESKKARDDFEVEIEAMRAAAFDAQFTEVELTDLQDFLKKTDVDND